MSAHGPAGMLVVDKPGGMTSHDVVEEVRRRLGARAGHAGTLDPQATGVLLVCTGNATRLAQFLQDHDKVYQGVVRLGWATDTYDAEGEPLADPVEPPELEAGEVRRRLEGFAGEIEQVPPAYSAKKVRGEPAYRRVRRGEDVVPEPVEVVIHEIELLGIEAGEVRLRLRCSAGTYVRTLAHDLGEVLGCPAHLAALRRLRSGPFGLETAVTWDELVSLESTDLEERLLPPAAMLPEWPAAVVDEPGAEIVGHGGVVEPARIVERRPGSSGELPSFAPDNRWARVLDTEGRMLAAAELLPGGILQPRVVLVSGS